MIFVISINQYFFQICLNHLTSSGHDNPDMIRSAGDGDGDSINEVSTSFNLFLRRN
jgi:hypothetical protein